MSAIGAIVLQNSFWGDDQNFSGPLMRFARGDMRDHIVSHKNDHGASYRRYGVLQWRSRLRMRFCEIFGAAQFSTFATQSSQQPTLSCCQASTSSSCFTRRAPSSIPDRSGCAIYCCKPGESWTGQNAGRSEPARARAQRQQEDSPALDILKRARTHTSSLIATRCTTCRDSGPN